jgi:tetratricopeptide (TPR) repeat protein
MAISYHQLGIVAQNRGDLDTAERWYQRSLEINETLDHRPGLALTFAQLGLLVEQRDGPSAALDWPVRCIAFSRNFHTHPRVPVQPS